LAQASTTKSDSSTVVPSVLSVPSRRKRLPFPSLTELLWAVIGVGLMVGGTLLHLEVPDRFPQIFDFSHWPPSMQWDWQPIYRFSFQTAAVFLTASTGGPIAGGLAQVAYLALGFYGFPVFMEGGGLDYLTRPAIGYLLGYIPAAILVGRWAFHESERVSLQRLLASALAGLGIIHLCGLVGLVLRFGFSQEWATATYQYSLLPLPGQTLGLFLAVGMSFLVRKLLLT
jgi:biotin transport system substrate-specific component